MRTVKSQDWIQQLYEDLHDESHGTLMYSAIRALAREYGGADAASTTQFLNRQNSPDYDHMEDAFADFVLALESLLLHETDYPTR